MLDKRFTIWFTDLSGAGRSTLAEALAQRLKARGQHVEILDGDAVRTHLSKGLGFSRPEKVHEDGVSVVSDPLLVAFMMIVVALIVRRVEDVHGRKVREQRREREARGRALVRYVQLHRQCSEAVAYQRLATFVKQHVPGDDSSSIGCMAAHERQSLLEIAQHLLVRDPDAIDKM